MALKLSQARLNHSITILLPELILQAWGTPSTCCHYFPSGLAPRGKPRLLLECYQAASTSRSPLSGTVSVQSLLTENWRLCHHGSDFHDTCDSSQWISRFWTHLIHRLSQRLKRRSSCDSRMKFTRRSFRRCSAASDTTLTTEMPIPVPMASPVCCTLASWLNHRMQKKQHISVDAVQLALTTHVQSARFHILICMTSLVSLRSCAHQKICRPQLLSPRRQKQKVKGRRFSKIKGFIM